MSLQNLSQIKVNKPYCYCKLHEALLLNKFTAIDKEKRYARQRQNH
jgi:hypothetical protein